MITIRENVKKNGQRTVTVVLDADEKLMSFKEDRYYKLGGQVEDVVQGHVIIDSDRVYWCSVSQKWQA